MELQVLSSRTYQQSGDRRLSEWLQQLSPAPNLPDHLLSHDSGLLPSLSHSSSLLSNECTHAGLSPYQLIGGGVRWGLSSGDPLEIHFGAVQLRHAGQYKPTHSLTENHGRDHSRVRLLGFGRSAGLRQALDTQTEVHATIALCLAHCWFAEIQSRRHVGAPVTARTSTDLNSNSEVGFRKERR